MRWPGSVGMEGEERGIEGGGGPQRSCGADPAP